METTCDARVAAAKMGAAAKVTAAVHLSQRRTAGQRQSRRQSDRLGAKFDVHDHLPRKTGPHSYDPRRAKLNGG
jgi:hypothetical protein